MAIRLAIFESHPIQYFVPLYRELARHPEIELRVHYFSDHSIRGGIDPGFGVPVAWDLPLTEGYDHVFLRRDANLQVTRSVTLDNAAEILRDGQFDAALVSGYRYPFCRQVMRACRKLSIPVVQRAEFTDARSSTNQSRVKFVARSIYLRRLYRRVSAFCYIGQQAKSHLLRLGVPTERLFFSPYCVDDQAIAAQRAKLNRHDCRAELNIAPDQLVVLFSGKLISRKQPLLLIEALRQLPDCRRISLIMLGDGELRGEVEKAGRNVLRDRFHLMGFVNQSQLGKYFSAADVFVLPSEFETWGLVVNEAMHYGLPVIVSDNVGCRADLVIENETGFSFPSGNAAALAEKLGRFVQRPELGPQLGVSAEKCVECYTIPRAAAGIIAAFNFATLAP